MSLTFTITPVLAVELSPATVVQQALENDVCTGTVGLELAATCATIASTPSGGGNAGSAGASTGVLNSTTYSDRAHKKSIEEREKELKEKGTGSGDILSGERLGFFVSGQMTETERKNTTLETGYESDTNGVTVGMDYFFTNQFVGGLAISYSDTDLDFNSNAGFSDYESVSVTTYANFMVNNNFSIDGYVGWTGIDYDMQRNISLTNAGGTPITDNGNADTEANKILAGLNFYYKLNFNALAINPSLKLDYSGTFLDGYSETTTGTTGLALQYDSQDVQSFKSNLGFNSSYDISIPWGVIIPQIHAGYVHEFLDDRRVVHASFVQDVTNFDLQFQTDKPDRDYFVFGGGISAVLVHSVQLFVNYERIEGHRYLNSYTVSGGVRVGL